MNRTITKLPFLFFASGLLFVNSISFSSPTENEFDSCKKLARVVLEYCLAETNHYDNEHCWQESSSRYRSCVGDVKASHIRNSEQIEAEKKALKERVTWKWQLEHAALYDSVLSITQDKKQLSTHEVACDLSSAMSNDRYDESAATIDIVVTKLKPDGILVVTCTVGAHSEQVLIIDPSQDEKHYEFIKVGSYFVDWYVNDGQLWIRYDEPCKIKQNNECDVSFSTIEMSWP
ncbi:MAG: hypothetical protein V7682_02865 [Cycloclasticus sp.]